MGVCAADFEGRACSWICYPTRNQEAVRLSARDHDRVQGTVSVKQEGVCQAYHDREKKAICHYFLGKADTGTGERFLPGLGEAASPLMLLNTCTHNSE